MSIDQNVNEIWIRAYTPAGYQTGIMLPFQSAAELDSLLAENGYLTCEPGLEPGQKKETISRVVRRQHTNSKDGTVTPIIDFYVDMLDYKYAHLYLNTEADIRQFEAQSGLKLASLKLYDGDRPLDKEKYAGKFTEYSHPVARSFTMTRTPDGTHEGGNPKYIYAYFAELPTETPPPATNENPEPGQWASGDNLNTLVDMMQKVLGVDLFTLEDFAKLAGVKKATDIGAWDAAYPTGKEAYEAALKAHARNKHKNPQPLPDDMEAATEPDPKAVA
jgi:hypothetical protein